MSIIIRLQNLPWSANAENIRQFFGNLVIPDGGVHIVGGEHGDAFIAFGSDEDARQAMAKDGGDIKGVKVRLLLSSRVEMQKVIDTARQQALSSQNLLQTLSTAVNPHLQYDPSAPAMPVNIPPNLLSALPGLVNLPGLNSLPMMQNLPSMPGMPAGMPQMPFPMPAATAAPVNTNAKPAPAPSLPTLARTVANVESADKKKENAQQSVSRTQKSSKSRSRSRSSSRSRDRRGHRDKYRNRDSRSNDRKHRRDRSKSRDRDKKSDRSRSRDRYRRRSRSRERRNDDRSRDYRNRSKERRRDSDRGGAKKDAGNSAEPVANAAKTSSRAGNLNNPSNVALAGSKQAANEVKIPGLGDKPVAGGGASATPPLAAAAKSSPSIDAAKGNADPKAAWPASMMSAWSSALPTSERKSAAEPPKSTSSSYSTPAMTSVSATIPQMPPMPTMPGMPGMPGMPMSMMGAPMSSMPSGMPYSMAAAYSMAYAAAPNNMYPRFPLTAQQAAAMYPGFPMSMMAQSNFGQYQPSASSAPAAAAAKSAAQQPEKVDSAARVQEEENGDDEEEVDCFGRVRKKSRRPSYSPEKVSSSYENGDRYDRRDSYKSRGDSYNNKSYHRDSYNHEDNRFHRSGPDDGNYRNRPYRRNFDRHDGSGDDRPRGTFDRRNDSAGGFDRRNDSAGGFERRNDSAGGFDRRNENSTGDRRSYQSRFDGGGGGGGGDDERKGAPFDSRTEHPGSRHSRFEEAARGGDHRRNYGRFEDRGSSEDRPDRAFRPSKFDDRRRNIPFEDLTNEDADSAQLSGFYQTCVEVRNIVADVTEQDIKRFFEPIPLYDSCIKFQFKTHSDGSSSTSVLVKFVNESQRAQALQLSGKFLKGQRTLILECDQQTFEKAEGMKTQLQQPYLKLAFVPKRATPDDIANAFTLPPDEVIIVHQNGRESSEAFLKFADIQPAAEALKHKDKMLICNSRVKLSSVSEAEFSEAKKTAQVSGGGAAPNFDDAAGGNYVTKSAIDENQTGKRSPASGEPAMDVEGGSKVEKKPVASDVANAPALTCIRLNSLPLDVIDKDIVNFLEDVDVHPRRIHMMYTPEGKMSGEAFCEFSDEATVHGALQKDRCLLNNHIVEMTPISLEELMIAVNDVPTYDEMPPFDGVAEPFDPPVEDSSHMYAAGFEGRGGRPFMGRGLPRRPFGAPRGPYAEQRGGRRPPGPMGPLVQPRPDQFGRPGCVVSLENVPYKAHVEDIMDFFADFKISRSDVIRRFNEYNLATGDARVSLENPAEAMRAVQTLDGQKIFDRYITVRYMR